jgi:hypothetical protein
LIFAPKNFKNPARLFDPSVNVLTVISSVNVTNNPSVNVTNNPSVNVPTDHAFDVRALQDVHKPSVIVAQFYNFLSTLCEIPTGASPSVIVAQFHNFLSTFL